MSNLAKVNRVLEIFWWAMTGVTLIAVLIFCAMDGFDKWSFYLFVPVLTAIMALVRRFMSKRLTRSSEVAEQNKKKKK